MWAFVGLLAMAIAMKIDYRHYKRPGIVFPLLGVTAVMLILVLFLPKVNDTHRWIRYFGLSLQPSEIAKLALTAYLAYLIESRAKEVDNFKRVFIPATAVASLIIVLVAAEPDLGTAMALGIVYLAVTFYAGVPLKYLAMVGAARSAPDLFGQLLAIGLTVMIIAQAFFNISVTLSLVPTKGIPLPFISSGGSSLAISLFAAGVLLNVSKHEKA